jgi:hypothetical protein
MIRPTTIIAFGLAFALGAGMFKVKYAVQAEEQKLASIQQQMVDDQNALHVLHADWSSETQPQQLGEMAERHLTLVPVTGQQLASFDALPKRPGGPAQPAPLPSVPAAAPVLASAKTAKPSGAAPVRTASIATAPITAPKSHDAQPRAHTVLASVGDSSVDAVLQAMQADVSIGRTRQ